MKKLLQTLRSRFSGPRWRHGWLGALLTAGFILFCILLNVGVKALEDTYGWTVDLSFNGYATTGEETKRVLDRLNRDVELYLLYQGGDEDAEVLALLRRYEVLCEHIRVLPTDIARNPGILTRFRSASGDAPEADCVIVSCPETGRYRVLTYEDFITLGYNVDTGEFELSGLAYEKMLTEAILFTSQSELPVVGILQGHNELDENALAVLTSFLGSNNYVTLPVSLLAGDVLDEVNLLLIASPQKDLTAYEAEQIAVFAQSGGHFFILRDYSDPLEGMPNYLALLRDYGVVPMPGVVAAGTEDTGSFYSGDVYQLLPYMESMDMTRDLIATKRDILLMPYASAFETPGEPTPSLTAATVLKTGPHGRVLSLTESMETDEEHALVAQGEISVGLYAHRMFANGNVSRMLAVGASPTFIWDYIYASCYTEEFLIAALGDMLPESRVSLDIMASTALRPALTVGSQTIGIALTVAIPFLVLLCAVCVLLPRRNR